MAALETIRRIGFELDPRPTERGATRAKRAIKSVGDQAERTSKKTKKSFLGVKGAIASVFTVGTVTAFFKAAVDGAREYELAMVRVTKVTGFNASETAKFRKEIFGLARNLPNTTTELLSIGAAAAQLGVKGVGNITLFTDTIARLSSATDVVGAEGAKQLARVLNVTRENINTVGDLADTIVNLGNNFAATESEITKMTLEISKATGVFGVASQDAAALGATLISLGVQPELAGTSVGKVFIALNNTLSEGGEEAERLAKILGRSAADIKRDFQQDAIGVFRDFIEQVDNAGDQGLKLLESFGVSGARVAASLLPLAKNMELYGKATTLAGNAQGALKAESDRVNETFDSQVKILKNQLSIIMIELGETILPTLLAVVKELNNFMTILSGTFDTLGAKAAAAGKVIAESFSDKALKGVLRVLEFSTKFPTGGKTKVSEFFGGLAESEALNTNSAAERVEQEFIDQQVAKGIEIQASRVAESTQKAVFKAFTGIDPKVFEGTAPDGLPTNSSPAQDTLFANIAPLSSSGGGGGGGSAGPRTSFNGVEIVKAQLQEIEDAAREIFEGETFGANLDRIRSALEGTFNAEFLKDSREELELLAQVMRDKVETGAVSAGEAFQFGLLERIKDLGNEAQQAFDFAQVAFDNVGNAVSDGFTDMILGTKSVSDAFRDMAVSILSDLAEMIIRQQVFNALAGITGGGGSLFTSLFGGGATVTGNAIGRRTPGGGGVPFDFSQGARPGQSLAVVEDNEVILRPQDMDAISQMGSGGMGGGVTVIANTHVTVNQDGSVERETSVQGGDIDGEILAGELNSAIDSRIGELLVTPGSPIYQG